MFHRLLACRVGLVRADDVRTPTLDHSGHGYVSGAGFGVFIIAAKRLKDSNGVAQFTSLIPAVRDVFRISGRLTALGVAPPA